MSVITGLVQVCHATAKSKGWWEPPVRTFGDQIALMHSELSEALEEFRRWGLDESKLMYYSANTMKPEGIAAEFADVLIRIFDTCGYYGIPLEEALEAKMEYNKTRSHKHGNKVI